MSAEGAVLAVIAELRQSVDALKAEVAARDDEIAALRRHLADHPDNQEAP